MYVCMYVQDILGIQSLTSAVLADALEAARIKWEPVYVGVYICMYVFMYVCIYVCMYVQDVRHSKPDKRCISRRTRGCTH